MSRRARVTVKRKDRLQKVLRAERRGLEDFNQALRLMGLAGLRTELTEKALSRLARLVPKPRVVADAASPAVEDLTGKCRELRHALDGVGSKIGETTLSFDDFYSPVLALYLHTQAVDEANSTRAGAGRAGTSPAYTAELFMHRYSGEMEDEIERTVLIFLARHYRLDGPIYSALCRVTLDGRKCRHTTTLLRTEPVSVPIVADGISRRAFRCGAPVDLQTGEIAWVSWDAQIVGASSPDPYPVFIQSHAIEQAIRRLHVSGEAEGFFHGFFWRSLNEPKLTRTSEGRYLVDVRIEDKRVGYFAVEVLSDKVLVRTFLLPTMSGTPGAEKLYRRLRLTRPDIEHLELDNLGVLIGSDLFRDEEIAEELRQCGCEDLAWFVGRLDSNEFLGGYADRFRGYLRPSGTANPGSRSSSCQDTDSRGTGRPPEQAAVTREADPTQRVEGRTGSNDLHQQDSTSRRKLRPVIRWILADAKDRRRH